MHQKQQPSRSRYASAMPVEPELVGRTFDDFLFRPRKGAVRSRRAVRLTSRLSRSIELQLPIVSANMDSVTTGAMARTLALEGGIGFVHRALPIDAQAAEVSRVKRSHGFVVEEPIALPREVSWRRRLVGAVLSRSGRLVRHVPRGRCTRSATLLVVFLTRGRTCSSTPTCRP